MSLLTLIKAQFGKSNTPANNFVLDASADNGTMKLARGNAGATTQDILTVDAAGKVLMPQNAQTWQNVTGIRALNTDYTNTTGQVIDVVVTLGGGTDANTFEFLVGGVAVATYSTAALDRPRVIVSFRVPAGSTYKVNRTVGTVSVANWAELR